MSLPTLASLRKKSTKTQHRVKFIARFWLILGKSYRIFKSVNFCKLVAYSRNEILHNTVTCKPKKKPAAQIAHLVFANA